MAFGDPLVQVREGAWDVGCQAYSHMVTAGFAWNGLKSSSATQMSTSTFKC